MIRNFVIRNFVPAPDSFAEANWRAVKLSFASTVYAGLDGLVG